MNTGAINMERISLKELVKLIKEFVGKEWDGYTKEEKMKWIYSYRKVENDTEKMIKKHGSVEKWYESGEGRLL